MEISHKRRPPAKFINFDTYLTKKPAVPASASTPPAPPAPVNGVRIPVTAAPAPKPRPKPAPPPPLAANMERPNHQGAPNHATPAKNPAGGDSERSLAGAKPRPSAASILPSRIPLEPAQRALNGWPLAGHENQLHVPLMSGNLNGTQFYRCGCRLLLAEVGTQLWWVPTTRSMVRLENLEMLAEVLSQTCWFPDYRRRKTAAQPLRSP